MGADKLDEHESGIVCKGCDQAIGIALDVENDAPSLEDARVSELCLDVGGSAPPGADDFIMPGAQRLLSIGILSPEIAARFSGRRLSWSLG